MEKEVGQLFYKNQNLSKMNELLSEGESEMYTLLTLEWWEETLAEVPPR